MLFHYPPLPLILSPLPSLFPSLLHNSFIIPLSWPSAGMAPMTMEPFTGARAAYQGAQFWRRLARTPFEQSATATRSSARGVTSGARSSSMLEGFPWIDPAQGFWWVSTATASLCVPHRTKLRRRAFTASSAFISPPTLLYEFLSLGIRPKAQILSFENILTY